MSVTDQSIRAVLFDKDGTLIDFHASWISAGLRAARELCALAKQPQRYHWLVSDARYEHASKRLDPNSLWACGTTDALLRDRVSVLELGEQGDEELVARIGTLMSVETGRQIVPLADLAALFSRLREKGLRVGVATMDLEANAQMTLQRFGVRPLVDFVCGCDSGHGNKSGPWMVLAFCASCGLDPRQVVVVGDTPHDMNMARAAGAGMAVAVTSGAAGAGELAPLADHVIDNITALVSILDSQPASSSG